MIETNILNKFADQLINYMNFLITGITGFAGPHLAELLIKNNHTVYGLIMCSNGRENDIRDVH